MKQQEAACIHLQGDGVFEKPVNNALITLRYHSSSIQLWLNALLHEYKCAYVFVYCFVGIYQIYGSSSGWPDIRTFFIIQFRIWPDTRADLKVWMQLIPSALCLCSTEIFLGLDWPVCAPCGAGHPSFPLVHSIPHLFPLYFSFSFFGFTYFFL